MSISSKYRKACGMSDSVEEDGINFNKEEQLLIKQRLLDIALNTDDLHLAGKLLIQMRDDGMGRKELNKAVGNNTFNIVQLNSQLAEARELTNRQLSAIPTMRVITDHSKAA